MQEHRQVSRATNEVGGNQLSSCLQPAQVRPLCEALLAVDTGHTGAGPCCHEKGWMCAPLAAWSCPVKSVLGAVVVSVL